MLSFQEQVTTKRLSYWQVFRLIFVVFSLYLVGVAFYRWDGFRYYATFSEFLPSVALVTVLWSIVAVFIALLIWILIRALKWFCLRIGWKIKAEHFLFLIFTFVLLSLAVWFGKKFMWSYGRTALQSKLIVFLCVTFTAIFLTWLFRNKTDIIQERITPLVWLFGIWVILSLSLVVYHTWLKQTDNVVSPKILQPSSSDKNRLNVILVTFDALTARDMSVYGYHRLTTPFISELAKSASLFTRLEAESTHTSPTTASLMTGKRVWTHQTYHPGGSKPVISNIENLALVLKNNGYHNMAFIVNPPCLD